VIDGAPGRTRTGIGRVCSSPPICFGPQGQKKMEEARGVEPPGPWSGGLASRCAKPACTSLPLAASGGC